MGRLRGTTCPCVVGLLLHASDICCLAWRQCFQGVPSSTEASARGLLSCARASVQTSEGAVHRACPHDQVGAGSQQVERGNKSKPVWQNCLSPVFAHPWQPCPPYPSPSPSGQVPVASRRWLVARLWPLPCAFPARHPVSLTLFAVRRCLCSLESPRDRCAQSDGTFAPRAVSQPLLTSPERWPLSC